MCGAQSLNVSLAIRSSALAFLAGVCHEALLMPEMEDVTSSTSRTCMVDANGIDTRHVRSIRLLIVDAKTRRSDNGKSRQ